MKQIYASTGATLLDAEAVKVGGETAFRAHLSLPIKAPDGTIVDVREGQLFLVHGGDGTVVTVGVKSGGDTSIIDTILSNVPLRVSHESRTAVPTPDRAGNGSHPAWACRTNRRWGKSDHLGGRRPSSLASSGESRVPDEPRSCRAEGGGRGDESDNDGDHEVLPLSAMPASLRQRYRAVPRQCQWQRDWFAGGNRLTA